jgi:hypothetical protein
MSLTQKQTTVNAYAIDKNLYQVRKKLCKVNNSQWVGLALFMPLYEGWPYISCQKHSFSSSLTIIKLAHHLSQETHNHKLKHCGINNCCEFNLVFTLNLASLGVSVVHSYRWATPVLFKYDIALAYFSIL